MSHQDSTKYISREAKFQERDLQLCRKYADAHKGKFNDTWLKILESHFAKLNYLTAQEHDALINVIEKWGMEAWSR